MDHYKIYDFIEKYSNDIKALVYAAFVFLNIDTDVVKILMLLMAFDTVFGVIKALVLSEKFNFKILLFGVTTKTLVLLIPMTLALVGKGLRVYDFTPLVDVVLRVLVVAEGLSIFTSFYVIRTKKKVENVDLITMLLSSIRKALMRLIKIFLVKIEADDILIQEEKLKDEK